MRAAGSMRCQMAFCAPPEGLLLLQLGMAAEPGAAASSGAHAGEQLEKPEVRAVVVSEADVCAMRQGGPLPEWLQRFALQGHAGAPDGEDVAAKQLRPLVTLSGCTSLQLHMRPAAPQARPLLPALRLPHLAAAAPLQTVAAGTLGALRPCRACRACVWGRRCGACML